MAKVAVSIDRMNAVSFNSTVAFFDFNIGVQTDDGQFTPLIKVKDCSLIASKQDDSYWISYPSKPRMKGGAQVQENGKPKYDNIVDTIVEQVDGSWKSTDASYKFKNYVTGLATARYNELQAETGGRGAPRQAAPAPRPQPAAAAPAPAARARAAAAPALDDTSFDLF